MVNRMQLSKALRDQGFLSHHIEKAFQIVGTEDPQVCYDWLKSHYPRRNTSANPDSNVAEDSETNTDFVRRGDSVQELIASKKRRASKKRSMAASSLFPKIVTKKKQAWGTIEEDSKTGEAKDKNLRDNNQVAVKRRKSTSKKNLKMDELAKTLTLKERIGSGLLYLWLSLSLAQAQKVRFDCMGDALLCHDLNFFTLLSQANAREKFLGDGNLFPTVRQFQFHFKSGHNQGLDAERKWGVRPIPYLIFAVLLLFHKPFTDLGAQVLAAKAGLADPDAVADSISLTVFVLATSWIVVAVITVILAAYAVGKVHLKDRSFEFEPAIRSQIVRGDASTETGRWLNRFVDDKERQFQLTEDGAVMNARVQVRFLTCRKHLCRSCKRALSVCVADMGHHDRFTQA